MDGIELEIVWSNLISIVSEQAKAMQRIAFSPIVREAGDLANALFDRRGRMVAQAVTGTPGHINSLAAAGKHFVEAFPTQTIEEGDVLITNDPWLSAGHFFDITVMVPVFHKGKLVGYLRLDHPSHRHRRLWRRRRRARRARGRPVDPDAEALRARRAQQGAARDHPPQRAHAERSVRRSCRAGVERQARRQAPVRAARPAGLRRHRATLRRDHLALRGRDARVDPQAQGRAPITARARSTCRAATSSRSRPP